MLMTQEEVTALLQGLELHREDYERRNRELDKRVSLELCAQVIVGIPTPIPKQVGWCHTHRYRAGGRRAHVRLRIPVWLGDQMLSVMLWWRRGAKWSHA